MLEYIYVADVFGKTDRSSEFSIDADTFEAVDWRTVGLGIADREAVMQYILTAQEPLRAVWQRREAELAANYRGKKPCILQRALIAIGLMQAPQN